MEVNITHPKQEILEDKLSLLCSSLDNHLESVYEGRFSLHPNRLKRGSGANPSFDGLFSTSASFTLGYGSKYGRGYLINVDIRTLDFIPNSLREEIKTESFKFLSDNLKLIFPERKLEMVKDGSVLKIVGDFSLGTL